LAKEVFSEYSCLGDWKWKIKYIDNLKQIFGGDETSSPPQKAQHSGQ
jgi:hypothetical protein